MNEFASAKAQLLEARKGVESARRSAREARDRAKAFVRVQKKAARSAATQAESVQEQDAAPAQAAIAAANAFKTAKIAAKAALTQFAPFTDPRRNAARLSDAYPFLLFPVRLETRFMATVLDDAPRHQLWVRIYPDDCSIDTFEPTLSAAELANAKIYWQNLYRAGGAEADQRAAWRSLVAAHGSGRAGYIVDIYQPTNLPAPTKGKSTDEILVITTQAPPIASDADAISAYWKAVWVADGDAAALFAARAELELRVGPRAQELIDAYQPFNIADRPPAPLAKKDVALSVAFLLLPPDPATKHSAWTEAPHVAQFPERFIVLGYNGGEQTLEAVGEVVATPIYVGPDPLIDPKTDPNGAIHPENGDLFVPDELKWMVDFDAAVAAGLGLKIDLNRAQSEVGFDRLLVLGLQISLDEKEGKAALEELLRHHARCRANLSLAPQGVVTHNTTGKGADYATLDDADQSFDDRRNAPLFAAVSDPMQKRDGQWLAELLGVDPGVLTNVHASGGQDQMRARAMQRALWPATMGYWMDKLLTPVFSDDVIASTRWFVSNFVLGCGASPAIRISSQPYGVLPTTSFSRISWLNPRPRDFEWGDAQLAYVSRLFGLLRQVDADWGAIAATNSHVGKPGDAHQLLLDVIGLHASSVEYYSRSAESLSELFNVANLWGIGPSFFTALEQLGLHAAAAGLLNRLGYGGAAQPDILQHYFLKDAGLIKLIVDDQPLSETRPIRSYTDDKRNYIQWLIDASSSLDALRAESGFSANVTPQALLYLYLRHALMLGYYDVSYGLHKAAGFLSAAQLGAMKPEPPFIHVAGAAAASESRFAALYKTEARITGDPTLLVSDFIARNIFALPAAQGLKDQIDALKVLVDAPTAQLERAFAEHIDLCTYRFDSWMLGVVNFQLQRMRADGEKKPRGGVYLGAYAWVENLRPRPMTLTPAQIPNDIAKNFSGSAPIMQDKQNGGYIHAPSLTQARTAAILRSGYLANATPANPGTMSVDLSSDRVRLALSMLEGVRNGQSIGALLGYRFERGLHDDHGPIEVDKYIYPLRKAFPLVSDNLAPTKTDPGVPIEAIEARNVLDGRKLVNQMLTSDANKSYPFGMANLPVAAGAELNAINAEANRLLDIYDAIGDVALAEGVHQAAMGNFDRIGATLNAYTTGNFPPDPEVVQTRPSGIGLTHRVAAHFRSGLSAPAGATPRAVAEPALDDWLKSVLPKLDHVGCLVKWTDDAGSHQTLPVTLADLAVRPIDVLGLLKPDNAPAMTELDDRVLAFAISAASPRPDYALAIAYLEAPAGKISIFQLFALLRQLRALLAAARPLQATDASLGGEASNAQNATSFVDRARIANSLNALDKLSADISAFITALTPQLVDTPANRDAMLASIDDDLDKAADFLSRSALFGVPESGWGFAYAWSKGAVADLLAQADALKRRWDDKLADFDAKVAAYDALPIATSDADRMIALRIAEAVISTSADLTLSAAPALRLSLDAKRLAFATRLNGFAALPAAGGARFVDFYNAASALLPISDFDAKPFDLTPFIQRVWTAANDVARILQGRIAVIDARRAAAKQQLAAYDAAADAPTKTAAAIAASKALFGEDFRIYPEFSLSNSQSGEWTNAVNASTSGTLLAYLKGAAQVEEPVDEWLYGTARVRPAMRALEGVITLSEILGGHGPSLLPAQFPYAADASWLALQFPPKTALDGERLLYTAHYTKPFDGTLRQCGALFDEWTEVIPHTTYDTGLTFNYNRPDNEPPQSILIVTPASSEGAWVWADLVGALNDTLDLAKKRSVEPTQLDYTPYAPLLPATVMATTLWGISISTSLAVANGVFRNMEALRNG
jgi:hypothetical protein